MAYESNTGIGSGNHYGPSEKEAVGHLALDGSRKQLVIDLHSDMISNDIQRDLVKIPAGSLILSAYLDVSEVFVVDGTTKSVSVGTDGSEATNGVTLSEAVLEATGVAGPITLDGTWAAKLAAETTIGIALDGGTTITDAGKARLVIEYLPG